MFKSRNTLSVVLCALVLCAGSLFIAGCSTQMPREMTVRQVAAGADSAEDMRGAPPSVKITSYEECVAAGNATTRSLPPRCITSDGQSFVGGTAPGAPTAEEPGSGVVPGGVLQGVSPGGIRSFEECVAAGYAIRRSLPPSCADSGGRLFTEGSDEVGLVPPDEVPTGARFCKDLCGDGVCQEIVCMAVGCPCAESSQTCPKDCAS